jgi:hypothetical protein
MNEKDFLILEAMVYKRDEDIDAIEEASEVLGLEVKNEDITCWLPASIKISQIESFFKDEYNNYRITMESGDKWTIKKTKKSEKIFKL